VHNAPNGNDNGLPNKLPIPKLLIGIIRCLVSLVMIVVVLSLSGILKLIEELPINQNAYGKSLYSVKNYDEALRDFKSAVFWEHIVFWNDNTQLAYYYQNCGLASQQLAEYENSADYFEKSIAQFYKNNDEINEEIAHAHYMLGLAYSILRNNQSEFDNFFTCVQ